ncbi:hypothetical protein ACPVPU_07475 [Sphingomonas sp. CJ99]
MKLGPWITALPRTEVPELTELAALCDRHGLRWRWRAEQLTYGWRAEVNAGFFDEQWQRRGATPRHSGSGPTGPVALGRAAASALHYWQLERKERFPGR